MIPNDIKSPLCFDEGNPNAIFGCNERDIDGSMFRMISVWLDCIHVYCIEVSPVRNGALLFQILGYFPFFSFLIHISSLITKTTGAGNRISDECKEYLIIHRDAPPPVDVKTKLYIAWKIAESMRIAMANGVMFRRKFRYLHKVCLASQNVSHF
jgi:hypothetical protein